MFDIQLGAMERSGDMNKSADILNKRQNYQLWQSGAFGNKLRSWRSLAEWRASGFTELVVLRSLTEGGGPCVYDLKPDQVASVIDDWNLLGIPTDRIMLNEAMSKNEVVLQGEYLNDIFVMENRPVWSYLYYSREPFHMRDALKVAPATAYNLRADLLLRMAMTPSSYEDWLVLLDKYPAHVLEVSVFNHCVGDTPGRNALVWEVRKY
jgi:hypothetical protein